MSSWLDRLFNTKKKSVTTDPSLAERIDVLVLYLKEQITSPGKAGAVLDATNHFFKKNKANKLKGLTPLFLLYEQYLTEVERSYTKRKLHDLIKQDFTDLLNHPSFNLVFESEKKQEVLLGRFFLTNILNSVISILGDAPSSFFVKLKTWLDEIPSAKIQETFPYDDNFNVTYLSDNWFENLTFISNALLEKLEKQFGISRTQQFYENAYKRLAISYKLLDSFPSVIALMPDRYLDADKMGILNKHQITNVLLEKTRFLEELNETLQSKNTELENTTKKLVGSRLETEKALNQLTAVLNTMNEGIITADEHGVIVMINQKVVEIFGYQESELIDQQITILMPFHYRSAHENGMQRYMSTKIPRVLNSNVRIEGLRKDGSEFPLELNIAPTVIEEKMFFTAAVKDITKQVAMEQELIQSRDQLEIRVKERTKDLRIAQQELESTITELERSNNELEQFAYVASHDLKEPLRMIGSYVKLIKRRYGKQIGEGADTYFHFALDGVTRMERLINDLLGYSKVGSAASNFKVMDMNEILDIVKINLTARIDDANAKITTNNLPTQLCIDSTLITQIFQNLIGNAIKFRKKEVAPIVTVTAQELENHWQFCIEDNGIGIPQNHLETIFVIFKRANPHGYEGTGIGLAVVKKIVELHRGSIQVSSEEGKGSKFSFTIWKHFQEIAKK